MKTKPDAAARIACVPDTGSSLERDMTAEELAECRVLATRIRRAIGAAVKKERHRCVAIAEAHRAASLKSDRGAAFVCDDIIGAIGSGKAAVAPEVLIVKGGA